MHARYTVRKSIAHDLMIHDLRQEINCWEFQKHLCEENALNGIKRLSRKYNSPNYRTNLSHPVREGISLIYFIRKSNASQQLQFGAKQIEWTYHCCIGFKDIAFGKDWIKKFFMDPHFISENGIFRQF